MTPQKGSENVSLLQQEASKSTPKNSQFTFTCESDSSSKMIWPGQNAPAATPTPLPPAMLPNSYGPQTPGPRRAQGTQTNPITNGVHHGTAMPPPHPQQSGQQPPPQARKSRPRRPGREYALAARQRRLQQEYNNFHNPPSRDEIWICEFCEYEAIFGHPPEALIRQYEIKDRKERKRLAEKRRLLEKAKMKGRKGKKNGKAATKNSASATQQAQVPPPAQRYDQPLDHAPTPNMDNPGDEYYEDEYDDLPAPDPPAPHPVANANVNHAGGTEGKHAPAANAPLAANPRSGNKSAAPA